MDRVVKSRVPSPLEPRFDEENRINKPTGSSNPELEKPINGLRFTDEEIKLMRKNTFKLKKVPVPFFSFAGDDDLFRYKLSLLLFDIFEEINQHEESWNKCNQFVSDFCKENNYQLRKF